MKPIIARSSFDFDAPVLSFLDMIEIMIVDHLRRRGLTVRKIRRVAAKARAEYAIERPFAGRRLFTDGRTLFIREPGAYLDLDSDQRGFVSVLEPYLRELEFDNELARRWWPLGQKRPVVIDPRRSFGAPIVASGVPVQVLVDAWEAENEDLEAVADWFEISTEEVASAVEYHQTLCA